MNKRGQFYLIAAVMIVLIVSSLTSVTTYAIVNSKSKTIQDLGKDLKEESSRVIDYGVCNSENLGEYANINELIEDFISEKYGPYFLKRTENANVFFVYGDKTNLQTIRYKEEVSGIILMGSLTTWTTLNPYAEKTDANVIGNEIMLTVLDNEYTFELKDNEMFYFIILQEKGEERYIEMN